MFEASVQSLAKLDLTGESDARFFSFAKSPLLNSTWITSFQHRVQRRASRIRPCCWSVFALLCCSRHADVSLRFCFSFYPTTASTLARISSSASSRPFDSHARLPARGIPGSARHDPSRQRARRSGGTGCRRGHLVWRGRCVLLDIAPSALG